MKRLICEILILAFSLSLALLLVSCAERVPGEEKQEGQNSSVGTSVGEICPDISIDILGSDLKFDVQQENAAGRVVVLNFWFTRCGYCLRELPYFYEAAKDYGDKVSVIAVHIEQPRVNVTDFILNESGHPEWNDGTMKIGWDTSSKCMKLFDLEAFPVTVVINSEGVITDNLLGALTRQELRAAIEKALSK